MQKSFIIIHSHPGMTKMSEGERQSKAVKSAFLQQYIRDAADVDVLLDAAYKAASASDEADYFDEVPAIIGQLYSYSLHFNAIRKVSCPTSAIFVKPSRGSLSSSKTSTRNKSASTMRTKTEMRAMKRKTAERWMRMSFAKCPSNIPTAYLSRR